MSNMLQILQALHHLLLATDDSSQSPVDITPSRLAEVSGCSPAEARLLLDILTRQGVLRRAAYGAATCPRCHKPITIPGIAPMGQVPGADPIPLLLAAVWCAGCQHLCSLRELGIEPVYTSPSGAPE